MLSPTDSFNVHQDLLAWVVFIVLFVVILLIVEFLVLIVIVDLRHCRSARLRRCRS